MPREGVLYEQVAAVADSMASEGIKPTMKNIRERLGTGSAGTIQKHLNQWRDAHSTCTAVSTELPQSIIFAINKEIELAKSETRAELEDQLVVSKNEATDLAEAYETLEAEREKMAEEIKSLSSGNDMLTGKLEVQSAEIERLLGEVECGRNSAGQARTEATQFRYKLETQSERLLELTSAMEKLMAEKASESQARSAAERELAVINERLDAEYVKSKNLLQEKETLLAQVDNLRKTAESARIEVARITSEFELQATALAEVKSAMKELTGFYETEKNGRRDAEKEIAILVAAQKEHDKEYKCVCPLTFPEPSTGNERITSQGVEYADGSDHHQSTGEGEFKDSCLRNPVS